MPPVEDEELVRRIRATNAGDTSSGNDLHSWKCRRCGKKGLSETPNAMSSAEPDDKHWFSRPATVDITTPTANVNQESSVVRGVHLVNDREPVDESSREKTIEAAPVKRPMIAAKRAKLSVVSRPEPDPPTKPTFTPQDEMGSVRGSFSHTSTASSFRLTGTVSAMSIEDDVEMQLDPLPPIGSTFQANGLAHRELNTDIVTEARPPTRAASPASASQQQETAVRPQADQDATDEMDDDPDDLYGPPVERRIIRILPSLDEELREQQERVAAEKEKRWAPLAPDWILARHAHDPSWKEVVPTRTEGRKKRKQTATSRKLMRDNNCGLNASESMGYFTVGNWVRESSLFTSSHPHDFTPSHFHSMTSSSSP